MCLSRQKTLVQSKIKLFTNLSPVAKSKDLPVPRLHCEREWMRIEGSRCTEVVLVKGNAFQGELLVRGGFFSGGIVI